MKFLAMLRTVRYFQGIGFTRAQISDILRFSEEVMRCPWDNIYYQRNNE